MAIGTLVYQRRPEPPGLPVRLAPRPVVLAGREGLLADLDAYLTAEPERAGPRLVALCGLGGAGKTSVAVEYAHRHLAEVGVCWQFPAEDPAVLVAEFGVLAAQLGAREVVDLRDSVASVHAVLARAPAGWLVIFDNAPDRASVERFMPPAGRGRILITTQNQHWPPSQALEVPVLEPGVAADFLMNQTGDPDRAAALELAAELGGLPLALEQAAAYVRETGTTTLAGYLPLFRARRADLLARGGAPVHPASVAATLGLALSRLEGEAPPAAWLMRLLAFLAPEPIPLNMLLDSEKVAKLPAPEMTAIVRPLLGDPLAAGDVIRALRRYSLVTGAGDGLVLVHRLTQAVLCDSLTAEEAAHARSQAETLLAASAPRNADDPATWPQWEHLMPHVLAADPAATGNPQLRTLALEACSYLIARGEFRLALRLAGDLYEQWSERFGGDDGGTHTSALYLAWALDETGDHATARDLAQDNLDYYKRVRGDDHPDTLAAANNLAIYMRHLGEAETARALDQEVLDKRRLILGNEHPLTIGSVNNLGDDLRALGEAEAAHDLDRDTLERCRQILGDDHPLTLISSFNLAIDLCLLGELEGASELAQDNLDRRRRILGDKHPRTLESANNCGFFKLPNNPEAAFSHLAKASASGKFLNLVTVANAVLALHLLGRNAEALALGSSDATAVLPDCRGWMWLVGDDHKLKLSDKLDVRVYLQGLMRHIGADCAGGSQLFHVL